MSWQLSAGCLDQSQVSEGFWVAELVIFHGSPDDAILFLADAGMP